MCAMNALSVVRQMRPKTGEWEDRAWFPPGPQLAVCLSSGFDGLCDAELMELAAAARRQASWAQARELAAIAELSRRRTTAEDDEDDQDPGHRMLTAHESVVQEVAAALTLTANAAATLVHLADRLSSDLPATRQALETGRIDLAKARVICDLTDQLPDRLPARVETAVLDTAPAQTTGQLRRRVRRLVQRLAPDHLHERKRQAIRGRRLELWDTPDGTTDLALTHLNPADAHAIHNKITAAARGLKHHGDRRPLDTLRADLAKHLLHGTELSDAVRALLTQPAEPPAAPAPAVPTPAVPAPAQTPGPDATLIQALAAMADQRLTQIRSHAQATGRTHALPHLINRAVQDIHDRLGGLRETWCQTTGPTPERHGHTGHTGHTGHSGYRPPAAMRSLVQARHTTCVFPTCNQRSHRCDLDHTIPWGQGTTCPCNLAPLCRRHHRTKQTPGWNLTQPWPGLLIWTTPSGTWHITLPHRE